MLDRVELALAQVGNAGADLAKVTLKVCKHSGARELIQFQLIKKIVFDDVLLTSSSFFTLKSVDF